MLKENRRASSVSNNSTSPAFLMDSPLSSIKYSYPGLGKRVLGRSIEKERSEGFVRKASEIIGINGGGGIKDLNPVDNPLYGISKDKVQHWKKMQSNCASSRNCDTDSDEEDLGESTSCEKNSGEFIFPILHNSHKNSKEKPTSSLEVFHPPLFPATPHCEGTHRNSKNIHGRKRSDLHRRLVQVSLDKASKSFIYDSNSETYKFGNPKYGTNAVVEDGEDKESDSSSDLFEIESFTTQETCYPLKTTNSLEDASSIPASCELMGFQNSFLSRGTEKSIVSPSAQSSCYEPSEASLDWSVTTGDTMDKASLGNFYSYHEEMKRPSSLQNSNVSGLREATLKGSSKRRSRGFSGMCKRESCKCSSAHTLFTEQQIN